MIELSAEAPLADAAVLERSYSGDALNVAVAVHRLGVPSAIVTRLGEDPFGDYLLGQFRGLGVDLRYVKRGGGPTGLYVVEQGGQGAYSIWYYDATARDRSFSVPSDNWAIVPGVVNGVTLTGFRMATSKVPSRQWRPRGWWAWGRPGGRRGSAAGL